MKKDLTIDGCKISPDYPPYIIAEFSANHNGEINRAYQIMDEVKKADAIKLQTYTHETISMDCDLEDFQIHGGL